jgi:hypothetical protein
MSFAAAFVAVAGFAVSGSQTVLFLFSEASAHLFAGSVLKTVADRELIASLKRYISFPVNALDILP